MNKWTVHESVNEFGVNLTIRIENLWTECVRFIYCFIFPELYLYSFFNDYFVSKKTQMQSLTTDPKMFRVTVFFCIAHHKNDCKHVNNMSIIMCMGFTFDIIYGMLFESTVAWRFCVRKFDRRKTVTFEF